MKSYIILVSAGLTVIALYFLLFAAAPPRSALERFADPYGRPLDAFTRDTAIPLCVQAAQDDAGLPHLAGAGTSFA